MMEKLTKQQYIFLKQILQSQVKSQNLTQEQMYKIINDYEEAEGMSFIKIILSIGAILIGLGILSFIASNWFAMHNILKLGIIFVFLGSSILTAFKLNKSFPKTSKAFIYLSILIYGSGIFLISQMFHLGGSLSASFLMWTIGTVAAAFFEKDRVLAVAAYILSFIFILTGFEENLILSGGIVLAIFFGMNRYYNHLSVVTFFNNLYYLLFLMYILNWINFPSFYITWIYFLVGLGMLYINHKLNVQVFKLQGSIIIGMSGLILTVGSVWREVIQIENAQIVSTVFGICFVVFLLSLVKKQMMIPLVFTCAVIIRYYFDVMYDFLPKSLFFILGGIILLGFGIHFEKIRKQ